MEYKLLIIKNRYKKKLNFKTGLDWFSKNTPIKIIIDEIETDYDLTFKTVGNGKFTGVVVSDYLKLRKDVPEGKYNAVALVYGNDAPGVRVSICENIPLYQDTDFISLAKVTDSGKTLNHELFHAFFWKLYRRGIKLTDPMDTYLNDNDLNSKNSNRTAALKLLQPHWETITSFKKGIIQTIIETITPKKKYKYFSDSEIVGLKPELVDLLDKARELAGIPFKISSGKRTAAENKSAGGVEGSAHLLGYAVDLVCTDSSSRSKIINSLIKVGFTRIGIGKTFVHADCDPNKPQQVIWHYY